MVGLVGFHGNPNNNFAVSRKMSRLFEQKIRADKEQEHDFVPFSQMEDLLDKFKLLNYEVEVLKDLKMKPLHKFYFVVTKNPGEQFYLFTILASFLIGKMGIEFKKPQEFDDPNDTIDSIFNVLKEADIPVNFSASKVKQGVGKQVVYILDSLANEALKKFNFKVQTLEPPTEKEEEIEMIDDESELNLDQIEEEMAAQYFSDNDSTDENFLGDPFHLVESKNSDKPQVHNTDYNNRVDEDEWKLELERVLPQLKVTIKNESRDWRSHLEQMRTYKESIDKSFNPARLQLDKVHRDINGVMEKINSREKYLNRELEGVLGDYRVLQDQLSQVKDSYKGISGGVSERNRELSKLTDRLETVKQQMEERGSSMTDGSLFKSPLVKIKKTVARIKAEIVDMDVRIAVLDCILLQSRIMDEKNLETEFGQAISVF